MGVPVITWPQSRVVSRQTLSILSAIGLAELAAEDADDYVHKAVTLAGDSSRLAAMRSGLRARMSSSPLMDVSTFTRSLESALRQTYSRIATSP
jgi:predicted O-linked N-acetylglucosamine transferase (SPINDLY family)